MAASKLRDIGGRQSLLGPRFVGLMRWLGGAAAGGAVASGAALAWAHFEARRPVLRRHTVEVPARPGLRPFQVLHISDLHMFAGQEFITNFLAKVAAEEDIDLVVSTGDNLGSAEAGPLLLEALEPLLSLPGAFVLGSNDYYSPDAKPWTSYLRAGKDSRSAEERGMGQPDLPWVEVVRTLTSAGWLDLTNQNGHLTVNSTGDSDSQKVALLGVDDPHIMRDRMPVPDATWWDGRSWRLALTHSPYRRVLDRFAQFEADLILAGHTHGGQVRVPGLGAMVNNSDVPRRYSRGLRRWKAIAGSPSAWVHVSAGLGTSRYAPVRFACRPEVSLLRVCPVAGV